MSWTIESWAKFEEQFEQEKLEKKEKIKFNQKAVYKTIFLPTTEFFPEYTENINKNNKRNKRNNLNNKISQTPKKQKTNQKNPKRGRRLEEWQYEILFQNFKENTTPDSNEIKEIAEELKITSDKVKNWFQNYRAKIRRENI